MTNKSWLRYAVLGITAAALPVLCGGILTEQEVLTSRIPAWAILHERDEDLTVRHTDGTESLHLSLHGGKLELYGEGFRFTADETWLTADCLILDVDRDGTDEILLHVWKPGSFGQYQPFWREPDNKTLYSEHLFLYDWDAARPDRLDPKWMSSAMPVCGQEVTADANGVISVLSPDGTTTRWYWEGWGLYLGNF